MEKAKLLYQRILSIIPSQNSLKIKGDNGVVAIIGGSFEYTGCFFR